VFIVSAKFDRHLRARRQQGRGAVLPGSFTLMVIERDPHALTAVQRGPLSRSDRQI